MHKTAKELVEVTEQLVGKDGRTFPTQRDIRKACGDTGSFDRMDQALKTVQVARGILPPELARLDKEFAAVLATMAPPTVAPTFAGVTGLPPAAVALIREAVVLASVEIERQQAAECQRWEGERGRADVLARSQSAQIDSLTDTVDEMQRVARETDQQHTATTSGLREQKGVLEKEVEFLRNDKATLLDRISQLETERNSLRDDLQTERERRHAAEKTVAGLEAEKATRHEMQATSVPAAPEIRVRRERKPKAA